MSKKPKVSRHRIPTVALQMVSDQVDETYEAEVAASVAKLTARYAKVEKARAQIAAKRERARLHLERVEAAKTRAAEIAANREQAESEVVSTLARIKEAAQRARVESQRLELDRRRAEALRKQAKLAAQRREDARAARARETEIHRARSTYESLVLEVEERERELRAIERLMTPDTYNNRDSRARSARHTAG